MQLYITMGLSPLAFVLPQMAGLPRPLLTLLPPAAFWLWSHQLFRGIPEVPARSSVLLAVLLIAGTTWIAHGWRGGLSYQGRGYVLTMSCIHLTISGALLLFWSRLRRKPSFVGSLCFHAAVPAWLITFAFPYFGELP
jgi:hypothetical protein